MEQHLEEITTGIDKISYGNYNHLFVFRMNVMLDFFSFELCITLTDKKISFCYKFYL